ncbi:hypothetical protein [Streptomyces sp. STCH 565 A]|uniref:hypothetical protein n=1 Tax=Streptomyces sp. STCH 565 A TaxID=2950532 RepID=UPI0020762B96|nr:hypothetical protein [Streptomyces sp. STCH 565 A]MCM8552288.1 hypothetical protein [Streptomyces sp. STCH 565 A]
MPDYTKPNTPLTARAYECSVTAARWAGPGKTLTQQIDGSYTPQPKATVQTFLNDWRQEFANRRGVPVTQVSIASYTIREK